MFHISFDLLYNSPCEYTLKTMYSNCCMWCTRIRQTWSQYITWMSFISRHCLRRMFTTWPKVIPTKEKRKTNTLVYWKERREKINDMYRTVASSFYTPVRPLLWYCTTKDIRDIESHSLSSLQTATTCLSFFRQTKYGNHR